MYNEIYGSYYYLMNRILSEASCCGITDESIRRIVEEYGFAESSLYFSVDATIQDGSGYNLLFKNEDMYKSILNNNPVSTITLEQKRLIKTILSDKRIHLFLDMSVIERLKNELEDIDPLFDVRDIVMTETAADGDDYEDEAFKRHFSIILEAVKLKKILKIVFDTSRGDRKTVIVSPYKIEYGLRDDKFRFCAVTINKNRPSRYVKLNISRITQIIEMNSVSHLDCDSFIRQKQLEQPIEIEVTDMRNGFERIFTQLSNYKRISIFNSETHTCKMNIHCMDDDVQELLIVLLSFGPAIKILGPPEFKEKYVERVKKQMEMLKVED